MGNNPHLETPLNVFEIDRFEPNRDSEGASQKCH